MTQALLGLLAFVLLLILWVVLPHRVIHRRRPAGVRPISPSLAERSAPSSRPHPARATLEGLSRRRSERPSPPRVVDLRLQKPSRPDSAGAVYELVVDLAGVHQARTACVPVYRDLVRSERVLLKERYRTEIAGLPLAAGNVPSLERAARAALAWLLEGNRLPRFVFRAPSGPAVPVGVRDGRLCARVPGGPLIEATTLAALRDRLVGYLGRADLEVRALSWRDLRYHPACAVVEGQGLWAPLFWDDGRLSTPDLPVRPTAPGVAAFLRALREVVPASGPLTVICLDGRAWAELDAAAVQGGYALSVPDGRGRRVVDVWQVDGIVGCAPGDGAPGSRRVLLAPDVWVLAALVGRELERAGRARAEEVRVHRTDRTSAGAGFAARSEQA